MERRQLQSNTIKVNATLDAVDLRLGSMYGFEVGREGPWTVMTNTVALYCR